MSSVRSGWRKVKSKYCKACNMEEASEVHHIIARVDGGGNEEKNLIDLCKDCHKYAPNGFEEMKEYVDNGGHQGTLVGNSMAATILTLHELQIIDTNRLNMEFEKIGGGEKGENLIKGMIMFKKEVQKTYQKMFYPREFKKQQNDIIKRTKTK